MANSTKLELATLVKRKLEGGMATPSSSKYDIREVLRFTESAIAKMVGTQYKQTGTINSDWLKSFTVQEKYDNLRKEVYFKLPAPILSMKNNIGLYQVSPLQDQDNPYRIRVNGSQSVFSHLDVADTGTSYACYLEENKVYVPKKSKGNMCPLLIKMICSLKAYKNNEEVYYPSDMEADIIQLAYTLAFYGDKLAKTNNDNNPNTK